MNDDYSYISKRDQVWMILHLFISFFVLLLTVAVFSVLATITGLIPDKTTYDGIRVLIGLGLGVFAAFSYMMFAIHHLIPNGDVTISETDTTPQKMEDFYRPRNLMELMEQEANKSKR